MRRLAVIAVLMLVSVSALAYDTYGLQMSFSVDVDKIMTASQRHEFGIDKWSPKQKNDFKAWLAKYALALCNQFQEKLNEEIDQILKTEPKA